MCPKCKKGELQESEFDSNIGVCDNLDCNSTFKVKLNKRLK